MSNARRTRSVFLLTFLCAGLAFGGAGAARAQSGPVQWKGIDRIVAFADVHGAYAELVELLRDTGIVDAQERWAAGDTHLVSLGDLLDRGADSRKVMDLLMRLQAEATAKGGRVHVLLGNHEVMNLLGDLRYVEAGEYAAYSDMESPAERADLRRALEEAQGAGAGATFDQKYPPGYFGHRSAFSPGGKYGRWLLELPVAILLNDTLFMHAGPSSNLRGMSLQELDMRYRTALTDYLGLARRLEQAGLLQPGDEYHERPQLARDRLAARSTANGGAPDPGLTDAVQRFAAAAGNALLAEEGPNWYRGAALCNEAAEADVLLPLLQQFGASRLVVGHTPTRDARAVTRFGGAVVKLDTGMNHAVYKGRGTALLLQESGPNVRYAGEPEASSLQPEGLFVAPDEASETAVLVALRDGEVTVTGPRAPGELAVSVSHGGKRFPAVFQARSGKAASRELAAYRLDRLLGLGLVPVTVKREVQGQGGVLQGRPLKWVTQAEVQQQSLRGGGWCRAEPQYQLVYAFDTLLGNDSRSAESLLFDSESWFVYLTSHDRAFTGTKGLPAYLKARPPTPGAEVRRRLAMLDDESLLEALGDLLDNRARAAILERRDTLLAIPAAAATATTP